MHQVEYHRPDMKSTDNSKLGCLGAILKLLGFKATGGSSESDSEPPPYRLRDDFLSPAERSFYSVLVTTLGGDFIVCPKVNVADILFVANPHQNQAYRNRIDRKHVDFLICDAGTMKPRCVVELDDASHERTRQRDKDEVKDSAFAAAGLPLVRVKARAAYAVDELKVQIAPHLTAQPTAAPVGFSTDQNISSPTCPKCGTTMTLREAKRGSNIGERFWGCVNYPRCRQTIPVS